MRQKRAIPIGLALGLALIARPVSAQVVVGSVIDSASRGPLPSVTILLVDVADSTNRRAAVTDSSGSFRLVAPRPGQYSIYVRRLGYLPLGAPPRNLVEGQTRSIRFEMTRMPVMLDTIRTVTEHRGIFWSRQTRGLEWFTRHYREGKGFFTSGTEIILSRLNACDYFGQIPGLALSYIGPQRGESALRCQDGRYVVTKQRPSCFRTILDRKWSLAAIDSTTMLVRTIEEEMMAEQLRYSNEFMGANAADTLGRSFPVAQIAGIEVFRNRSELPKDFSIPPDMGPPAQQRAQLPGQQLQSGAPVAMTYEASMQCAYVLLWTRSFW